MNVVTPENGKQKAAVPKDVLAPSDGWGEEAPPFSYHPDKELQKHISSLLGESRAARKGLQIVSVSS